MPSQSLTKSNNVIIGTRGSPLALRQAQMVQMELGVHNIQSTIRIIKTTGDHVLDRPLAEIGGKGLFTKEIDEALLNGSIDLAVHSMKDVPTFLPDGIDIGAMLPRADVRDALVTKSHFGLHDLPRRAVVGTSSLRRRAQLKAKRPDLVVVPLRGNVATRMQRVMEGDLDATLLAMAGLTRLSLGVDLSVPLEIHEMLPAVGQGAIGIACRRNGSTEGLMPLLDHRETSMRVACERAVLARIKGDCKTSIGVLAVLTDRDRLSVRACLADVEGEFLIDADQEGSVSELTELGNACGDSILKDPRARAVLDAAVT